ncbi:MAG: adenylate cyclase, class 2 [Solirubrobacteraceae bacterium]|jgi:adenylate cyclase class 2|nr:adenylate cyclase, class 2 [Solirubrobacteraceae bacterium]
MVAVEAELKALARHPEHIHAALSRRAVGERSIYSDRYFDYPDRGWTRQGNELRVRTVTDELGRTRALLTFKQPAVDEDSGSKPEHETAVEDADVLITVLTALGVEQIIAFEKRCVNYRFAAQGRDLLATVVTVPELAGQTFIELETVAHSGDVDAALDVVRSVLRELGIEDSDLTTQAYTDAVATRRGAQ